MTGEQWVIICLALIAAIESIALAWLARTLKNNRRREKDHSPGRESS